ncbi:DinB family protein [Histidinibacterium aquaticum]|uniref:Damage-inducible protein DinB n=1 Tax=Histidinibacterium aquaticum TaxID=2613962 RepID=A0A5J5GQD6_9RHOB|nr:DinB family protein [Histidinibacterium aquaticum]KAA9009768.1 damage-inducible protein DinB [Histidinibacterium aquaticum]
MISPDYCRLMARYNAWQNDGLRGLVTEMPREVYEADRGAFFGSIRATLNHLLWADRVWMSRIGDLDPPGGGIAESVEITRNAADWVAERYRVDGRIRVWADRLRAVDLAGPLTWWSGASGREVTKPRALCIAHMFNHQTHHRGQVHAMLTQAGLQPPPTDLFLMPQEA